MTYHVQLEQFEGPLDLLLQLIEKEELDISTVSLARVTDQFIAHLNEVEERYPEELVDFLLIASRLMLMKSRVLLPFVPLEEEGDERPLEDQLRRYRMFVQAAERVASLWSGIPRCISRPRLKAEVKDAFLPPPGVTPEVLRDAFARVLDRMPKEEEQRKERIRRTISIREKIMHIRSVLFQTLQTGFRKLVGDSANKTDIIVTFLALLELVKQKTVEVSQQERFQDITIRKKHEPVV